MVSPKMFFAIYTTEALANTFLLCIVFHSRIFVFYSCLKWPVSGAVLPQIPGETIAICQGQITLWAVMINHIVLSIPA